MDALLELHISRLQIQISVYVEGRKKGSLEVHRGYPGGTAEGRPQEPHPGAQGVGTGHCPLEGEKGGNYQNFFFSFEETDVATIVNVAELQSYSFPKLLSSGMTFLKLPCLLAKTGGKVLFEELQNLNAAAAVAAAAAAAAAAKSLQ